MKEHDSRIAIRLPAKDRQKAEQLIRNGNFKKPDIQKWALHIDRMIRIDNRPPCGIMNVICWCQNDDFWQNNILSTLKLRKQYDQLQMKMTSIRNMPKMQQQQIKNSMESQRWLDGN